ncbi:hypothetical protein [Sedimentisphaera salicampi]|uniref:Uncharacterized protein n=1 Tax=Sedimentisphaera salicampi TaxID=1941349 RepID=A0A1W6LML5_9BACT|nr:hypothetical protein [Sedimentisphaera salicampi]ARN56983.1 hypothetical protein STSP1_01376 [Sedimentisphaera salicampi]
MKKQIYKLILSVVALYLLLLSMPYIYTAPVITSSNSSLIQELTALFQNKPAIYEVTGWDVIMEDKIYVGEKIKKIKNVDTKLLHKLMKKMRRGRFYKARRRNDFVLFFTATHHFSTVKYGLCYSVENINPNSSEDKIISRYKPYSEISPGWYISQKLAVKQRVLFVPDNIPSSSLIDDSEKLPKNWSIENAGNN